MKIIFTLHAKDRIKKRGVSKEVSKEDIIEAVKFPKKTEKKHGKYYAQKDLPNGIIEIVYEKENLYKGYNCILVNMKITFDKDADASYIEFREGRFSANKKIDDNTIIDLDKDGNILGIELLSVKSRIPLQSLSEIDVKNLIPVQ